MFVSFDCLFLSNQRSTLMVDPRLAPTTVPEVPRSLSTITYPGGNPLFGHSPCLPHHIKENQIYQVCCPPRLSSVANLSMLLLSAVDGSIQQIALHCTLFYQKWNCLFQQICAEAEALVGRIASISMFTGTWLSILHFSLFFPSHHYVLLCFQIALFRFCKA